MTPCKFSLGETEFEGFTDGTTWNGWANVWVAPEVCERIANLCGDENDVETANELLAKAKAPDARGLVSLAYGICAEIVS